MPDYDAMAAGMSQAVPFVRHLGLEVASIGEGEALVILPERPELANHVGSQHAGALFGAAEAASGAAFLGTFADRLGDIVPLARSGEISYDRIANGPIEARGRLGMPAAEVLATLDAEGKVVFPCEISMTDAEGREVATATVHWHVRLKDRSPPATS
jgi:acyl-coenzyme A thioesterase PaaI-like protein